MIERAIGRELEEIADGVTEMLHDKRDVYEIFRWNGSTFETYKANREEYLEFCLAHMRTEINKLSIDLGKEYGKKPVYATGFKLGK